MNLKSFKYLIGIDEVGRGPLAGPVTLCAVAIPKGFSVGKKFPGINDSKQLSEEARERYFALARESARRKEISYRVAHVGSHIIDTIGLSAAVRRAIKSCLTRLEIAPKDCQVYLDGSLYAPKEFIHQQTIIGGDAKIKIISLASVIAKVTRDRKMKRLAKRYSHYGFFD